MQVYMCAAQISMHAYMFCVCVCVCVRVIVRGGEGVYNGIRLKITTHQAGHDKHEPACINHSQAHTTRVRKPIATHTRSPHPHRLGCSICTYLEGFQAGGVLLSRGHQE